MYRREASGGGWLIWFIWSIWFDQTNETNQINKRNQPVLARHTEQFEIQKPVSTRRCLQNRG